MIKVALPNKGALFEPTLEMLNSCGYRVAKVGSALSSIDPENGIEFYFLRPGDIPLYVANGMLDCGITGKDFVAEKAWPMPGCWISTTVIRSSARQCRTSHR